MKKLDELHVTWLRAVYFFLYFTIVSECCYTADAKE